MVILAQNFSTRNPLVDGHGNWGSIDGDSAAAMRYTEARLTPIALEMLKDIDKNVVDMTENYSGSELEPKVLPSRYPNLLVNGTFGIAVGLATNIPPHNLGEIIDGAVALLENPHIITSELMKHIKGPDLPTGGIIIGRNALVSAYETGEGRAVLRAKTHIEKLDSGRFAIIISEFPYRKNKARILQTISDMTADKKHSKALEYISDIRDESDRSGIRAVIEFRRNVDEESVEKTLKYLLKKTDLQSTLSFNMVALANGKPETLGLKAILSHYIAHQKEVVTRRTITNLKEAEARFHVVEGYIKALSIMDEILNTIRASKSKADSIANLVSAFVFTQAQAEAIVSLMLYRLTNMEIKEFEKEYKELKKQIEKYKDILNNEKSLIKLIKSELLEVKEKYADERRTLLIDDEDEGRIELEEILVSEDVVITQSNDGFIKRVPLKSYNRSNTDVNEIDYREGDYNRFVIEANTKDTLLLFTDKGNMYQMKCMNIPDLKWKERGIRLSELVKSLDLETESIVSSIPVSTFEEEGYLYFVTSKGGLKVSCLSSFNTSYTKILATKLKKDDWVAKVIFSPVKLTGKHLQMVTFGDLAFSACIPEAEAADRSVLPQDIAFVFPQDRITEAIVADFSLEFDFYVRFHDGVLDISYAEASGYKKVGFRTKAFMVSSGGDLIVTACGMFTTGQSADLKALTGYDIVDIAFMEPSDSKDSIFLFTRRGEVKKTPLSSFDGKSLVNLCKVKDGDSVVSIDMGFSDSFLFMLSKSAMGLKFDASSFSSTNPSASTIAGMKLSDSDLLLGMVYEPSVLSVIVGATEKKINLANVETKNKGTIGVPVLRMKKADEVKKIF